MQVRRFEALVQTNYIVQNFRDFLGIGSRYAPDLLKVDAKTFKITCCMSDTLGKPKFMEIVSSIESLPRAVLREIMDGDDDTSGLTLPVFAWRDGKVEKTWTEDYEWPNTDHKGYILHRDSAFRTEKECVEYARRDTALLGGSLENWMMTHLEEGQRLLDGIRRRRNWDRYLDINYGRSDDEGC